MQTTEYIIYYYNVYYAFNMHVPIECRAGASETHKLRYTPRFCYMHLYASVLYACINNIAKFFAQRRLKIIFKPTRQCLPKHTCLYE